MTITNLQEALPMPESQRANLPLIDVEHGTKVVLVALPKGVKIAPHKAPYVATAQLLTGSIEVLKGETWIPMAPRGPGGLRQGPAPRPDRDRVLLCPRDPHTELGAVTDPVPSRPTVLIVGGGFGGLKAARALADAPVRVVLVDRQNHHLFQPLLYQVASATLSPADIAAPSATSSASRTTPRWCLGEVASVDLDARQVSLGGWRDLSYDFLILAAGSRSSYFGRDDWVGLAPGLKTLEDALEIRRRFLLTFERAEQEEDPELRREWLTFVIVGGGPTGVELAGTLKEMARLSLPQEFRRIRTDRARVILWRPGPAS